MFHEVKRLPDKTFLKKDIYDPVPRNARIILPRYEPSYFATHELIAISSESHCKMMRLDRKSQEPSQMSIYPIYTVMGMFEIGD